MANAFTLQISANERQVAINLSGYVPVKSRLCVITSLTVGRLKLINCTTVPPLLVYTHLNLHRWTDRLYNANTYLRNAPKVETVRAVKKRCLNTFFDAFPKFPA